MPASITRMFGPPCEQRAHNRRFEQEASTRIRGFVGCPSARPFVPSARLPRR
jgi:hypothetical protein